MAEVSFKTSPTRNGKLSLIVLFACAFVALPALALETTTVEQNAELAFSQSADRSPSVALDGAGAPADAKLAIFLDSSLDSGQKRSIRYVTFYVNGKYVKREYFPPYDLGGTMRNGDAGLVPVSKLLNEGENHVKAVVSIGWRKRVEVEGTLRVLPEEPSIAGIAASDPNFSILVEAVIAAGLLDVLSDPGTYTVFAPTNDAFLDLLDFLGITKDELFADKALLTTVLTYHVLGNALFSPAVLANETLIPLQGEPITVDPVAVKVNESNLGPVDIAASNGVIHVIDAVLLPPSITDPQETIAEIASGIADFSILVEAAVETGLVGILAVQGTEITVFAPTNAAFVDLLGALGLTKDELFANKPLLTTVLLYHLVNEELFAADVLAETELFPMESEPLAVDADNVTVGGVGILDTDIDAANGVIHVIDGVLVPPAALQLLGN